MSMRVPSPHENVVGVRLARIDGLLELLLGAQDSRVEADELALVEVAKREQALPAARAPPTLKVDAQHAGGGRRERRNADRLQHAALDCAQQRRSASSARTGGAEQERDGASSTHWRGRRSQDRCQVGKRCDHSIGAAYEQHGTSLGAPSRALRTC
eukprot:5090396-Prymnesium_polylepis.2